MEITSQNLDVCSATAFPGSDAPRAHPAAEVENLSAGFFNTRNQIFIGCWNVRTLLDVGSQVLTLRTLFNYKMDITCLSEVRLSGSGSKPIKIPGESTTYWLYHSGPENNTGQHGVAFALSSKANGALLSWNPVSSRIALARFKGRPFNLTVVSVYAPTLPSDTSVKDEFYQQLQSVIDEVPRNDVLVIAGDWNARVGPADDATRHILGKFGLGQRCENGERLINFAGLNRMFVSSTRFQHPRKHLLTWYSNDGKTAHQIDHVLIRSRWASSVENCRSYRAAEAGNSGGSDHVLVRAKLRLHLAAQRKVQRQKRLNVAALTHADQCLLLNSELSSKLKTESTACQTEQSVTVDSQWSELKTATREASLAILGTTSRRQKDWISPDTIHLSTLAQQARLRNSPDYRQLRRAATRSARNDRNRYWKQMADNMESAANNGDFGKLFRLIRSGAGKNHGTTATLKDASGHFIPTLDGKLSRWVEHFSRILNNRRPQQPLNCVTPTELYGVNCDTPTKEEIAGAIKSLKNKKAPGEDGIPAEIYKACATVLLDPLHRLFSSIWDSEVFPTDWSTSLLLPFLKKGDRTICENYRGISLLNVATKIFATVLLNRFARERHTRTRPNQGGFRPGRGCIDQIFTLRRILEHRFKFQQPTAACFIDFRAAFDSVDRESLWNLMLTDGAPPKIVRLIISYYTSTKARVRIYGTESDAFQLTSGVRQGCPLSPILFNYAIDWIMKCALHDYQGVQITADYWISDLNYADDVVVLGKNFATLARVVERINFYARQLGLEINTAKTKAFSTCPEDFGLPLRLLDSEIEHVDSFVYLGSLILPNGQAKDEIQRRVDSARRAFLQLKNTLWRRCEISLRTKVRVYQAAIRPVLLYGCETWPLRVEDLRKLEVFDHWCLRFILKIRWSAFTSNKELRTRCFNLQKLSVLLQQHRLRWFGHVLRKADDDLARLAVAPSPCTGWRCRSGGQTKTWLTTIKNDVDLLGLQNVYGIRRWSKNWVTICADLAADRTAWRAAIRDVHEAGLSPRGR